MPENVHPNPDNQSLQNSGNLQDSTVNNTEPSRSILRRLADRLALGKNRSNTATEPQADQKKYVGFREDTNADIAKQLTDIKSTLDTVKASNFSTEDKLLAERDDLYQQNRVREETFTSTPDYVMHSENVKALEKELGDEQARLNAITAGLEAAGYDVNDAAFHNLRAKIAGLADRIQDHVDNNYDRLHVPENEATKPRIQEINKLLGILGRYGVSSKVDLIRALEQESYQLQRNISKD